jgi:hypothetical protein
MELCVLIPEMELRVLMGEDGAIVLLLSLCGTAYPAQRVAPAGVAIPAEDLVAVTLAIFGLL